MLSCWSCVGWCLPLSSERTELHNLDLGAKSQGGTGIWDAGPPAKQNRASCHALVFSVRASGVGDASDIVNLRYIVSELAI